MSGPKYECPQCSRIGEWADGTSVAAGDEQDEYWCQTCGAEVPFGLILGQRSIQRFEAGQ